MNEVDSKRKACADKEDSCDTSASMVNGVQSDGEPPDCEQIVETIDKLKRQAKTLNGIVNGITDGCGVHHLQSTKTDTSHDSHATESSHTDLTKELILDDSKPLKKSRSRKKHKSDLSLHPDASRSNSNPCLHEDFDITSIIRDKYKQDAVSEDKVKIVVNQLDRLELKDDKISNSSDLPRVENPHIIYVAYESELQMPLIMKIIQKDLSEPYSIYTYRYFIHNWPNLCFLAMHDDKCVGAIVCKLDMHRKVIKRGYIAMLAVDKQYRKHGLGSTLVKRAIQEMIAGEADEVVLETEITNRPALRLYEALGFVRDKRLFRYYLNGVDALRLKLWLR